MSVSETATDIGFLLLAAAIGAALGILAWEMRSPAPTEDPVIRQDTTELDADELFAGLLPNETTIFQPSPTMWECLPVPDQIVDEDKPAPDTITKYETFFADLAEPSAPSVTWGDQTGLSTIAASRHPFLFLPLAESGEPKIDHDGRRTIVPAYDWLGNGYKFRYDYRRPPREIFLEIYGQGAWWPPNPLNLGSVNVVAQAGVDVGFRWREARVQLGPAVHSEVGWAAHLTTAWRPLSYSF